MGRLFDILLFDSPVRNGTFGRFRITCLCWSADEPIGFSPRDKIYEDAFHRILCQSDLVLYTTHLIQCRKGFRGDSSGVDSTRRAIIEAYRKHGLDVDSQAEEIGAYRRSAKIIENECRSRIG
jgi:hypothetical protein